MAPVPRPRSSWIAGRRAYLELNTAPLRKKIVVTAARGDIVADADALGRPGFKHL